MSVGYRFCVIFISNVSLILLFLAIFQNKTLVSYLPKINKITEMIKNDLDIIHSKYMVQNHQGQKLPIMKLKYL